MYSKPSFKALVYAQNVAKASTSTSNKTIMTTSSIGKDSYSILIMGMLPTHKTQW